MGDFYYRRNADRALGGMMGLSLEERGAYNTVLDLIYSRRNRLFDDDDEIRKWLAVDVRIWKRIKASLLAKEKIYISDDGFIRNKAADDEIKSRGSKNDSQAYPQKSPQGTLPLEMSGTSGGLPADLGVQVGRTYAPKSEGESIKNKELTPIPVRARESIVNKNNPLTPFSTAESPVEDLSDFNNLFRFAGWLLGKSQIPISEQQICCDWIEKGYDLNRLRKDLKRKAQKYREKHQGQPPRTLAYFEPMLIEKRLFLPRGGGP